MRLDTPKQFLKTIRFPYQKVSLVVKVLDTQNYAFAITSQGCIFMRRNFVQFELEPEQVFALHRTFRRGRDHIKRSPVQFVAIHPTVCAFPNKSEPFRSTQPQSRLFQHKRQPLLE
jgi:hypothetical protein